MPTLLSSSGLKNGVQVGNTSASSLVRSAQSLSSQINSYNDTVQRLTFENNPSDDNLDRYLTYLNDRVGNLESTGSITDATKALEMRQTMNTAVSKNTSFNIQDESIQVLSGNATSNDKLDYITGAYQRAVGIGDVTLAQSLESQAYTLSQKIQYDQEVAAQNAITVNNANESATKAGYSDALSAVKGGLDTLFTALKTGGQSSIDKALKTFTGQFGDMYSQLTGQNLPKGSQATLGSITQAYFNLQYAYNTKAAAALQPYNAQDAQKFTQAAQDLVSGKSTVSVPGIGSLNVYQANNWAASPNLYRVATDENGQNKLVENAVTGYKYVNGQAIPQSNGNEGTVFSATDKTAKQQILNTLKGLNVNLVSSGDHLTVQLTNEAIKKLHLENVDLKSGAQVTLVPQANGGLQFTANGKIYSLALDSRNLVGVAAQNQDGSTKFVGGQFGFNQKANTMVSNATVQQLQQKAQQQIQQQAQIAMQRQSNGAQLLTQAGNIAAGQNGTSALKGGSSAQMSQRAGGGFNFTNNGQSVSAATYSQLTGIPFRTLLQQMATAGDVGAKTALGFVGNDYKYDTGKVSSYQNADTYNALTWGVGVPKDTGQAPASALGLNVKF